MKFNQIYFDYYLFFNLFILIDFVKYLSIIYYQPPVAPPPPPPPQSPPVNPES